MIEDERMELWSKEKLLKEYQIIFFRSREIQELLSEYH